jgi:hypothetical protein
MKTKADKTRAPKPDATERSPDAPATPPAETKTVCEEAPWSARLPNPIELVNMAIAICGGPFPLDDDERDGLFRRALHAWFEARELLWFNEMAGQDATDIPRSERREFLRQHSGMHQVLEPRISGAAAMKEITGDAHQERAWKMLRQWMDTEATDLPETKPEWLSATFGKYHVQPLKARYSAWKKKHVSIVGKKGAAAKAAKKKETAMKLKTPKSTVAKTERARKK